MPLDPDCYTGARAYAHENTDGSWSHNVTWCQDGQLFITFAAEDEAHAIALADLLQDCAWVEVCANAEPTHPHPRAPLDAEHRQQLASALSVALQTYEAHAATYPAQAGRWIDEQERTKTLIALFERHFQE